MSGTSSHFAETIPAHLTDSPEMGDDAAMSAAPPISDTAPDERVRFTAAAVPRGYLRTIPIALGVFGYGLLYGALARQAGLSLPASLFMSGGVFAGASQLIALDMWGPHLAIWSIIVTTFVVNLRHVLMGATLRPWFSHLRPLPAYATLFLMTDESWALSMAAYAKGERDAGFFLGSGLAIYTFWLAATAVGRMLAGGVADPARLGLDFAFTAVFLALLTGFYRSRADLLPWAASAAAALVTWQLLPGKWYIIAGGLAGGLTAALRYREAKS